MHSPTPHPHSVKPAAATWCYPETRATSEVRPHLGASSHYISPAWGLHLYTTNSTPVAEVTLGAQSLGPGIAVTLVLHSRKPTPTALTSSQRNSLTVLPRMNLP